MSASPLADGPVPSPCINVCRMNEATGWCEGCLRSIDEIAAWASLSDAQRRSVCAQLPQRSEAQAARLFPQEPGPNPDDSAP